MTTARASSALVIMAGTFFQIRMPMKISVPMPVQVSGLLKNSPTVLSPRTVDGGLRVGGADMFAYQTLDDLGCCIGGHAAHMRGGRGARLRDARFGLGKRLLRARIGGGF